MTNKVVQPMGNEELSATKNEVTGRTPPKGALYMVLGSAFATVGHLAKNANMQSLSIALALVGAFFSICAAASLYRSRRNRKLPQIQKPQPR